MQWKPLGQTSICSCRCKGYLAEIFRGAKQPLLQMRFNTWTRSPPLTLKDTFFQRRQALRRRRRARADRVRGVTLGQLDSFMQSWKTEHLHGRTGRGPVVPPLPSSPPSPQLAASRATSQPAAPCRSADKYPCVATAPAASERKEGSRRFRRWKQARNVRNLSALV